MVACAHMTFVSATRILPADPRGAVGPDLALPDRNPGFDAIDERAACLERFAPMGSARRADDSSVANVQATDAVKRTSCSVMLPSG